ncbi:MAG: SpoVR family protein [Spirochaetales bacterium]|nr:SpoVR family protein [Spirochaetales bacterium]
MLSIKSDPRIYELYQRVLHHAKTFGRHFPEIRFFILDGLEFASLLEKNVYPASPLNIWEGKRMVNKKRRIETGAESSLYYEVVQTGNPAYAYLNKFNTPMTQASVMAHVVGHCEFSELNILKDSSRDRSEYVMFLVRKVDLSRNQMGEYHYLNYWNACESAVDLIAPNSQFNLERSLDTETLMSYKVEETSENKVKTTKSLMPFSSTLSFMITSKTKTDVFKEEVNKKRRQENLSRVGYTLKAPCQDVFNFLRNYAPTSKGEKAIMDYLYTTHYPQDFVLRTQIMNEGWAMYWEKKIMLELFKEKSVKGIIEYAKIFSGVCYPRPYFYRNPYHLGYNLWNHIEQLYKDGKVTLEYQEEKDIEKKEYWKKETGINPIKAMEHLIETITDYEFLRRFLSHDLIHELHLNRIDKRYAEYLRIPEKNIVDADKNWVWLDPVLVKTDMLNFFTHFGRPRIFVIDTNFMDGGLLLYHRDDNRELRKDWIKPTLQNINIIWKNSVHIISKGMLYSFSGGKYSETNIRPVSFEEITERMQKNQKPFRVE